MTQEQGARSQERGFRRVIAWQKAHDLASAVYHVASSIPARDNWLRVQLVSAALSVASNIAEGHGRGTVRDYIRFLEMAISSLNEVENHLYFLERNDIVRRERIESLNPLQTETGKVLYGLLIAMRAKLKSNGDWQRHQASDYHEEYGTLTEDWRLDENL